MSQQNYNSRPLEEEIDLREELEKYIKRWPWFILGLVFFIGLAFLYLNFATPSYHTVTSIIIKDEESKGPSSDMAAFAGMGFLGGMGANSIENEITILSSKRMMTNVIKALNLNISYYNEDVIQSPELYLNSPYLAKLIRLDERKLEKLSNEDANQFLLKNISGGQFELVNSETGEIFKGKFDQPLEVSFATVIVSENTDFIAEEGEAIPTVEIRFSNIEPVVMDYREKLQIDLKEENSSVIKLSLDDALKSKAQNILDQLVLEYNREAIEDKNLVARNTASFIDERLKIITNELDSVEIGKEDFKEANQLTDIEAESEMFIENVSEFNKREQELGTQLELANTMIDYLRNDSKSDLLPANLGIEEESVNSSIDEYNKLVLERNRILSGSTPKNPIVVSLNNRIEQIRGNVLASFDRLRSNLRVAQQELERRGSIINSKISAVPAKERQYRGIERQQNIKESLYLFLLRKREENSLSLAVTAPKAKIVDRAYSSLGPVSPKPGIVLLIAILLGLIIPFFTIYFKTLLSNKIKSREDIEKQTNEIAVVGEIL